MGCSGPVSYSCPRDGISSGGMILVFTSQTDTSDMRLRQFEGLQLTRAVYNLLSWMVQVYTRTAGAPVQVPPFEDRLLLEPLNQAREADKTAAELSRLQETLKGRD